MDNPIAAMAADPAAAAEHLASQPIVVGVAVAGLVGDEITVGTAGRADAETGAPVEPDTVFRPGSITKLLTATLVVQCAADGLLALDDPISHHLPDLDLGESHDVRVRHLISHCSGIDAGDLFVDTGDGPDCVARYVDLLQGAGFLFEPGTTFSYNNAGFALAGRIVEIVRGMTWEEAARAHILEPAGMHDSGFVSGSQSGAVDPVRHARGHIAGFGAPAPIPRQLDHPMTSRGLGPAGATLTSTAGDLARFLRFHLAMPDAPMMRELAAPAPGGVALMRGAGMGWMVWEGSNRVGGANPGMSGQLAFEPATGAAIATLTNTDQGVNAVSAVLDAGAPPAPDQGPPRTDLAALAGTYRSHIMEVEVEPADDGLKLTMGGASAVVTPINATTFQSHLGPIAFFDGLTRWRMRVLRRVS